MVDKLLNTPSKPIEGHKVIIEINIYQFHCEKGENMRLRAGGSQGK